MGDGGDVGPKVPGGRETQSGVRGKGDVVVGNWAEQDGAGGGTQGDDDDGFAGTAQALIFVDVSADPAAAILADPDHRVTSPNPGQQENRREQPSHDFHVLPQFKSA